MTSSRTNTYHPDPQDFFNIDPQPEAFSVDMVKHYSFLPTGVLWPRIVAFRETHGRASSVNSDDHVEVLEGQALLPLMRVYWPAE